MKKLFLTTALVVISSNSVIAALNAPKAEITADAYTTFNDKITLIKPKLKLGQEAHRLYPNDSTAIAACDLLNSDYIRHDEELHNGYFEVSPLIPTAWLGTDGNMGFEQNVASIKILSCKPRK